ncbi:MAG TPA: NAD(P)-dependent oxidoreductase [Mycobacteriales bacterium]|nr:NAD(P)-dependent oxidoreductase [Mycobacteriales bacterium]
MTADPPRVAVLGWGRMGGAIGRRLLAAGMPVPMFDPSPVACQDARERGASVAGSPAEACSGADIVVTLLPGAPAVREAADGPSGVIAGLASGALWMEMSSSLPAVTSGVAHAVEAAGARFLDAPVTGGVARAVTGELTVIAAGSDDALAAARPVLRLVAAHVFHVGPEPGMGDLVKTVNNLLSAANLVIAAEGLAIARRGGVDLPVLLDVLNAGTGQSNATRWKIPHYVMPETFDSGFTIAQYVKDLDIALRVARDGGLHVPMSHAARDLWRSMAEAGLGERDHTEAVRVVMERAAPTPPADSPPGPDAVPEVG